MKTTEKEQKMLDVLNSMLSTLRDRSYDGINKVLLPIDQETLLKAEEQYPEMILRYLDNKNNTGDLCISTLSMMVTAVEILTGKTLAAQIDDGYVEYFRFLE